MIITNRKLIESELNKREIVYYDIEGDFVVLNKANMTAITSFMEKRHIQAEVKKYGSVSFLIRIIS